MTSVESESVIITNRGGERKGQSLVEDRKKEKEGRMFAKIGQSVLEEGDGVKKFRGRRTSCGNGLGRVAHGFIEVKELSKGDGDAHEKRGAKKSDQGKKD